MATLEIQMPQYAGYLRYAGLRTLCHAVYHISMNLDILCDPFLVQAVQILTYCCSPSITPKISPKFMRLLAT
jgi:hypothetical protein